MCLYEYFHFMPFKNLLKLRKVNMAKYIYMWENLMQWCKELFTPSQVFFSRNKNWSSNTIRTLFYLMYLHFFVRNILSAYFPP